MFMSQIVFSYAWWIGTQAENPEEAQLDFPKELTEVCRVDRMYISFFDDPLSGMCWFQGQHAEYDFKGGAGSTSANKQSVHKNETTYVEEHSPNVKVEDNVSDDGNKDLMRATPVRHSARTAGNDSMKTVDVFQFLARSHAKLIQRRRFG
ncbi:hypothetical protein ACE6H2_017582 [Prunus campanulata]